MQKNLVCVSLFLFFVTFFTQPLFSAQQSSLTIVFSNDGHTNPYHVQWLAAFEEALKSYNSAFGNIHGYWLSASRIEEQYEQINDEIEKGVDILFVNAMSVEALAPLVLKAQKKGIIWVAVHNNIANADYNFILGDHQNGYHQGMALATYFNGKAKVAIMLGMRANTSGDNRQYGILRAFQQFPDIEVVAQEPADWSTSKALVVAEKLYNKHPDLDALSVVTDTYLYPAMQIAKDVNMNDILFFGHDGDIQILEKMQDRGKVKANILLSAKREGWNFVQLAYKIANNIPVQKDYHFYTPLVMSQETYDICLTNGFPEDIEVITIEQALKLSEYAAYEFGPLTINTKE